MNSLTKLVLIPLAVAQVGCTTVALKSAEKLIIPPPPVEAPDGFKWVVNEAYSDEFTGSKLDASKWHDSYPGWEGRVPGKFVPSAITLDDGYLRIKCTVLDPAQGDKKQWTVACGAIQSKAQDARFGYYETRMKASSISTSSTFWLMNPTGGPKRTELDIHECVGNAQKWPGFKKQMRSNTHVTIKSEKKGGESIEIGKDASTNMNGNVGDDFHTYGCWWVDANTMHFYLDGKLAHTIVLPTDVDKAPLDQAMFLNLVCETYAWEVPPTIEDLMDDSRNTAMYDYVRSYTLEKTAK